MTQDEYDTIQTMRRYGGSFIQALAQCFEKADSVNQYRLKTAFHDYWVKYEEMGKLNRNSE